MSSLGLMVRRVPAGPLRRMLLGWQARFGDDVATMAAGFDLPVPLMVKLLGVEPVRWLRVDEARTCCVGLRLHPAEIWPQRIAGRLGPVDWETETLWVDAGVDPVMVVRPDRGSGLGSPSGESGGGVQGPSTAPPHLNGVLGALTLTHGRTHSRRSILESQAEVSQWRGTLQPIATALEERMQRMRFWLVAVLMSGPVFLVSVLVRMLAWLVILSALVTWWGPGDAASDPVGGLAGLVGGLVLWAVATLPRWAAFKLGAWVRL